MSRRLAMLALLLGAGAIAFVAQSRMSSARADEPKGGVGAEAIAAVDAYNKAIARKDLEACMAAYAPGPDVVLLGTGPGERWQGPDEIREAHVNFFSTFDKEVSEPTWRLARGSGDVAWVASMAHVTDFFKGEKNEFSLNISTVLVKKEGKWQIALCHFSNLTGPKQPG